MEFDKTSFSVDWFTPGDKYAPKRLSFPKSACISMDDFTSDSPLSFCFSPTDDAIPQSYSHSFVDTPFERACGWTTSTSPSPHVPPGREPSPMHDQDTKRCEENLVDWRVLASPGILSVVDDCALCGVNLDVSCLDALDEQLLVSPVESFTDLCWETAIHEEVIAPVTPTRKTRSRARSFKRDDERVSPLARDYPGSFERTRPPAAKMTLPPGTLPRYISSSEPLDTSLMPREKPLAHILYTNLQGPTHALPIQGTYTSRRSKKRDLTLTPSFESFAPSRPSKPCIKPSYSSNALRVVSDAYSTFAGRK